MKKRGKFLLIILVLVFVLTSFSPAFAQDEDYRLILKREWGVGIPGSVQGHMSLTVTGNLQEVKTVQYVMDDTEMITVPGTNVKHRFNTDDYPSGTHSFYALITFNDGQTVRSNTINIRFLAKAEAGKINRNIFLGIGVLTVLILLLTFLINKRKSKQNQQSDQAVTDSGLYGAAICPKCGKVFKRTIAGLNLVTHRYEPCPHCGKWSMTTRASKEEIEALEQKVEELLPEALEQQALEKKQRLESDLLDESKYTEL
ncbi:MAG: hypothetical protein GX853_05675 [Chloroflexi bacterium]|nr:hypothetical protein [Chloroflexota bacterium]